MVIYRGNSLKSLTVLSIQKILNGNKREKKQSGACGNDLKMLYDVQIWPY